MRQRFLFATGLLALASAAACKGLGTPEDQAEAASIWEQMAEYKTWSHLAGHEGIQKGTSVHGNYVRTFVNGIGAANPDELPYGTILVKEAFSKNDEATLQATTVMKRIEGYDPENGDWFWARFTAAGEQTHNGQVAFCADCHFDAGGDDFSFLND